VSDALVVDDPDASSLPHGCILADHLRHLADVEKLAEWHRSMSGAGPDTPCLRRIEAVGDSIVAHISVGPPVGGSWEKFVLTGSGWRLVTDDLPL